MLSKCCDNIWSLEILIFILQKCKYCQLWLFQTLNFFSESSISLIHFLNLPLEILFLLFQFLYLTFLDIWLSLLLRFHCLLHLLIPSLPVFFPTKNKILLSEVAIYLILTLLLHVMKRFVILSEHVIEIEWFDLWDLQFSSMDWCCHNILTTCSIFGVVTTF